MPDPWNALPLLAMKYPNSDWPVYPCGQAFVPENAEIAADNRALIGFGPVVPNEPVYYGPYDFVKIPRLDGHPQGTLRLLKHDAPFETVHDIVSIGPEGMGDTQGAHRSLHAHGIS